MYVKNKPKTKKPNTLLLSRAASHAHANAQKKAATKYHVMFTAHIIIAITPATKHNLLPKRILAKPPFGFDISSSFSVSLINIALGSSIFHHPSNLTYQYHSSGNKLILTF